MADYYSPRWWQAVPAPVRRLFDRFPLVVYPANELPARSPRPSGLPTLHVFTAEQDAPGLGTARLSFNPSCLKWQTYLRLAGIEFRSVPSTNHASPSGALPFLLPSPSSSLSSPSQPIPASNLPTYAASLLSLPPRLPPDTQVASDAQHVSRAHPCHGSRTDDDTAKQTASPVTVPSVLDDDHRAHAYRALLNGPIRRAFLYAAYLSPSNADAVARRLYVDGATRHPGVRAVLASRLRDAARREVWCGSWRNDDEDAAEGSWWGRALRDARGWAIAVMGGPEVAHGDEKDERVDKLYAAAESALVALDTLLRESLSQPSLETERHDQDGKDAVPLLSATTTGGWFFASPTPTLFDAEVFGYVHLLLDDGVDSNDGHVGSWHEPASIDGETGTGKRLMGWRDNKLGDVIRKRCRALVAHRERVLDRCWR